MVDFIKNPFLIYKYSKLFYSLLKLQSDVKPQVKVLETNLIFMYPDNDIYSIGELHHDFS